MEEIRDEWWIESINGQRENLVDAILHGNDGDVVLEALQFASLLDLFYDRDYISFELFSEHQDFVEKCIKACATDKLKSVYFGGTQ